ncbi:hypothetical protein KEJ29_02750 [Candidatus Bathyarchaeota archaeon]|nr:hypothetical protein [Candidatus Bathyarchaeota archaeon]
MLSLKSNLDRKVYVVFQFDTEDFITPEADDIILRLIDILEQFGVKGSFCIVAEKLRSLERRGRFDVIDALKRHDIAYQSNLHSVHPVISEYLKDKLWDEGVEEVKRKEGPGLEHLKKVFGVVPSAFIQPGGSWAPETPYALREMGVPIYADGIFESDPVWFCGSLCLRAAMYFPEHSSLSDLENLKLKFESIYGSKAEGGLIVVVMHPCMFVTEKFWDAVNFSLGRNPPKDGLMPAPLRDEAKVRESLETFSRFLSFILEHSHVKVITFREVGKLFREPGERGLRPDQILALAQQMSERNDWCIIDGISISPAEALRLLTDVAVNSIQENFSVETTPIYFTLGPIDNPAETLNLKARSGKISVKDALELLRFSKNFMDRRSRVPPMAVKGDVKYGPGALLEMAAKIVFHYLEYGREPKYVELNGLPNLPEVVRRWNLTKRVNDQWRWIIFPEGFNSKIIEDLTLLQSWTIRPAIFVG